MTRNEMAQTSRDELIDLILLQAQQIMVLQAEIEALRKKLEQGKKPPTNSVNSSQPPSRDWKGNMPAERKKRRRGSPPGHAKHERKFVVNPDHLVEVKPRVCHTCQCNLSQARAVLMDINHLRQVEANLAGLENQLTEMRCQREALQKSTCDKVKRARSGVKASFGDDSPQFEMIGGTRVSDRKPVRRTVVVQSDVLQNA